MAIDNTQLVRRRLGDSRKDNTETFATTEDTLTYILGYENITIESVYDLNKSSSPLVLDTDYQIGLTSNILTLLYTPDRDSTLTVNYHYYAFLDSELDELIDAYGVNGACIEAVRWLIADASRLHDYSRGATSESLSQIIKNLQTMLRDYQTLGDPTTGEALVDMKVLKRTNDYYRGTRTLPSDLSRNDSLSI
jgi:hypothetical protein